VLSPVSAANLSRMALSNKSIRTVVCAAFSTFVLGMSSTGDQNRTRSGNTIVDTYDALNRLSTKAPTGESTATLTYDLHDRKLGSSTPIVSGNPATGIFNFYYDTAGRFYKESTPDSKTTIFVLDNNGNITKITYPDGYYVSRVYDQLNRLTDIKLNGATSSAVHITYDELSRREAMTLGNGVSIGYTFQLNEDLTSLAQTFVGSSLTIGYGFNNVHQATSQSMTDGTYMWHPSAGGTTTYGTASSVNEYPTVGSATYQYDGNANLKSDGTWTFTYDTENHLTASSKTGTSVGYDYDADHRQIQKTVGSTTSYYVYSGWQRIADYAASGSGALQNRYVYGDKLDEVLITVSSSGTLTHLHADRIGSIIATTNSSGAVTNKNKYSAYGENAPAGTTFGFTGQRYDTDTGLYYFKRRYYSPVIGRFMQGDPVGYAGGLNLYTYVRNDSLNRTDPLGLLDLVKDPWGLISGGNGKGGGNGDGGGDGGDPSDPSDGDPEPEPEPEKPKTDDPVMKGGVGTEGPTYTDPGSEPSPALANPPIAGMPSWDGPYDSIPAELVGKVNYVQNGVNVGPLPPAGYVPPAA
jgi:RHS repeat-associated protein